MLPLIIISLLMINPISLFKKTPFFLSTPVAYIIYFKNWNQDLNIKNNKQSEQPLIMILLSVLIIVNLQINYTIGDSLVGKRVGFIQSSIQRLLYFSVGSMINLIVLIASRAYLLPI